MRTGPSIGTLVIDMAKQVRRALAIARRISCHSAGATLLGFGALVIGVGLASPPLFAQGLHGPSPSPESASPPPQASPNDIDGETMFATSCGWCHQQGGRAPGRGPKLAGIQKDDDFIINRIKHGKPGAMPAFGRAFSDSQIIAILAYIRSLDDAGK